MNNQWVDHVPVLWFEPEIKREPRELIIFLPHLGGTKEMIAPYLKDFAAKGFVALSFDPWLHGERGEESPEQVAKRVFRNFRQQMWPTLGQSTLDTMKVIDWAIKNLKVQPNIRIGGISMGGDIAIAAAGLDARIQRVSTVGASPDWMRPGMKDLVASEATLPPGEADSYAQFFYDRLNPMTHLDAYARRVQFRLFCGDKDVHIPVEHTQRFVSELKKVHPEGARIEIRMVPGMGHGEIRIKQMWFNDLLSWLTLP